MSVWRTHVSRWRRCAGSFHCPQCGAEAPYDLMRARRQARGWFGARRRGAAEPYVACRRCGSAFERSVLTHPPTDRDAFSVAFGDALLTAMTTVAAADGPVSEAELQAMATAIATLSGVVLTPEEARCRAEIDGCDHVATAERLLAHLEPMLSPAGKEAVLRSLLATAAADGPVSAPVDAAVARIADAMGVPSPRAAGRRGVGLSA